MTDELRKRIIDKFNVLAGKMSITQEYFVREYGISYNTTDIHAILDILANGGDAERVWMQVANKIWKRVK